MLKERVYEVLSPTIKDNSPEVLAAMDDFLTSVLNSWLMFDLRASSDVRDIRIDRGDPKTGQATGFMWEKQKYGQEFARFIGDVGIEEKWPVSWVERPLIRCYGHAAKDFDDGIFLRQRAVQYDQLAWVIPMIATPEEYIYEETTDEDSHDGNASDEEVPDVEKGSVEETRRG